MSVEQLRQFDMVYLASPYSNFPGGIDAAYDAVADVAFRLNGVGVRAYSPILYSHPLAKTWQVDPLDHNLWLEFDEAMMAKADALVVAMLDTWELSHGVDVEVDYFRAAEKPIFWLHPETLHISTTRALSRCA